jgi:putative transposase
MARAKRHYLPGLIWHITHRCHKKEFLLKFVRDRNRWLYWLFQAKQRYGLCILNYNLTSNHIHLLVADGTKPHIISNSMNLVESRTAQEYNKRKQRTGAFWEDRYHATAVESGTHLLNCMTYIDFNMLRAGKVKHPKDWPFCGYNEIQANRLRYTLIDYQKLAHYLGLNTRAELRNYYKRWIELALQTAQLKRESKWTESLAVGSKKFVEMMDNKLGTRPTRRRIQENKGAFELREGSPSYGYDSDAKTNALKKFANYMLFY